MADRKKPHLILKIKVRPTLILSSVRLASSPLQNKEKENQKMPQKTVIWCLLIVCITLLAFIRITHGYLCEIHIKNGNKEVAAVLAYASKR
jgi:protein HokB